MPGRPACETKEQCLCGLPVRVLQHMVGIARQGMEMGFPIQCSIRAPSARAARPTFRATTPGRARPPEARGPAAPPRGSRPDGAGAGDASAARRAYMSRLTPPAPTGAWAAQPPAPAVTRRTWERGALLARGFTGEGTWSNVRMRGEGGGGGGGRRQAQEGGKAPKIRPRRHPECEPLL
jgi:hypothetical protein